MSADCLSDHRTFRPTGDLEAKQRRNPPPDSRWAVPHVDGPRSGVDCVVRDGLSLSQNSQPKRRYSVYSGESQDRQSNSRTPLRIREEVFRGYRTSPDRSVSSDGGGLNGALSCHVFCAKNLTPQTPAILQDASVSVELDSESCARTVVRTGRTNFDWDEAFDVDLHAARSLSFVVRMWYPHGSPKIRFRSPTVALPPLFVESSEDHHHHHRLALGLDPHGTLYVELRFRKLESVFRRSLSVRASSAFGADLASLVDREQVRGLQVPTVVWRCVMEVEKRGMEQVGIYRICGSAGSKEALRKDLERDPWTADLSSFAVPDINVISGFKHFYVILTLV